MGCHGLVHVPDYHWYAKTFQKQEVAMEEKICKECGSSKVGKYRKLCWSCILCHTRHGMTLIEWSKVKAERLASRGKKPMTCCLCSKTSYYGITYKQRFVCQTCFSAYQIVASMDWVSRAKGLWELQEWRPNNGSKWCFLRERWNGVKRQFETAVFATCIGDCSMFHMSVSLLLYRVLWNDTPGVFQDYDLLQP